MAQVHSINVSCPHKECDALQQVPLRRLYTGHEGHDKYALEAGEFACEVCGKLMSASEAIEVKASQG